MFPSLSPQIPYFDDNFYESCQITYSMDYLLHIGKKTKKIETICFSDLFYYTVCEYCLMNYIYRLYFSAVFTIQSIWIILILIEVIWFLLIQ